MLSLDINACIFQTNSEAIVYGADNRHDFRQYTIMSSQTPANMRLRVCLSIRWVL